MRSPRRRAAVGRVEDVGGEAGRRRVSDHDQRLEPEPGDVGDLGQGGLDLLLA